MLPLGMGVPISWLVGGWGYQIQIQMENIQYNAQQWTNKVSCESTWILLTINPERDLQIFSVPGENYELLLNKKGQSCRWWTA